MGSLTTLWHDHIACIDYTACPGRKNSILTNDHAPNLERRHCTSIINIWGRSIPSTANNIFKSGTPIAGTKWSIPSLCSCYMAFQWNRDVMIAQPLNMESGIRNPESRFRKWKRKRKRNPESNNFIKRKIRKQSSHSIIWSFKIKSPFQKEFVFVIVYKSIKSSRDGVQAHAKSIRILRDVIVYIFAY